VTSEITRPVGSNTAYPNGSGPRRSIRSPLRCATKYADFSRHVPTRSTISQPFPPGCRHRRPQASRGDQRSQPANAPGQTDDRYLPRILHETRLVRLPIGCGKWWSVSRRQVTVQRLLVIAAAARSPPDWTVVSSRPNVDPRGCAETRAAAAGCTARPDRDSGSSERRASSTSHAEYLRKIAGIHTRVTLELGPSRMSDIRTCRESLATDRHRSSPTCATIGAWSRQMGPRGRNRRTSCSAKSLTVRGRWSVKSRGVQACRLPPL